MPTDLEAVREAKIDWHMRFVLARDGRVLCRGSCWHPMIRRWRETTGATLWRLSPRGGEPLKLRGNDG